MLNSLQCASCSIRVLFLYSYSLPLSLFSSSILILFLYSSFLSFSLLFYFLLRSQPFFWFSLSFPRILSSSLSFWITLSRFHLNDSPSLSSSLYIGISFFPLACTFCFVYHMVLDDIVFADTFTIGSPLLPGIDIVIILTLTFPYSLGRVDSHIFLKDVNRPFSLVRGRLG